MRQCCGPEKESKMKNNQTWIGNTIFTWCEIRVAVISVADWFSNDPWILEDELCAGFFVKNDSKHQSDGVNVEKSMRFNEFSSFFLPGMTEVKADVGYSGTIFGTVFHTTPGAAGMGCINCEELLWEIKQILLGFVDNTWNLSLALTRRADDWCGLPPNLAMANGGSD